MKILEKTHLADSQYAHLNIELDPFTAGDMHKTYYAWGDEGQAIYVYETQPDNVGHNILERHEVNWPALIQEEAEAAEHMDAIDFFKEHKNALGPAVEVWTSEPE